MTFVVEEGNLFDVAEDYVLAHCISADYALGAGIAVLFDKKFALRSALKKVGDHTFPACIHIGRVFNLVTKEKCWQKPTYSSLETTLYCLRDEMIAKNISKIAMPLIGCDLDRLKWSEVSKLIRAVFAETNIDIRVRYLPEKKYLLNQ